MQLLSMSHKQESFQISKKALKKLQERLPKGFIHLVLDHLDHSYHKTSIYRVLKGEIQNSEILEALMDVADKSEERKDRLERRAKGITQKKAS